MKFLCLAYLDRGLAPARGVAAEYGALGEAMREAVVLVDSGQLSPPDASKLVRVSAGPGRGQRRPAPGGGTRAHRLLRPRLPRPR
jgi:hypothetical protein